MPNWCEGTLKIRGTKDKLLRQLDVGKPFSENGRLMALKRIIDCISIEKWYNIDGR